MRKIQFTVLTVFIIFFITTTYSLSEQSSGNTNNQTKDNLIIKYEEEIKSLREKIKSLESQIKSADTIENRIKKDIEILAANSLHQFAKEKLEAADYTFKTVMTLIGIIAVIFSIVVIVIRQLIIKKIEEKGKDYTEKIEKLIAESHELRKDQHQLFAYSYNNASIEAWKAQKYDDAIHFAERSIRCAVETWSEEPTDLHDRYTLFKYQSNLAYYYVEDNRREMRGRAIEYAKKGLEAGINNEDLNLIDNYLYIIMKFSIEKSDKARWIEIFETYKQKIYEREIRSEGPEQTEYNEYYEAVKAELVPVDS